MSNEILKFKSLEIEDEVIEEVEGECGSTANWGWRNTYPSDIRLLNHTITIQISVCERRSVS